MMQLRLPVSLYAFCRAMVVLWLLVLSGLALSNLATTAQIQSDIFDSGQERHLLALEEGVGELAGQLARLQERAWVHPDQLLQTQRELNGRIRTMNDNLAGMAKQSELQALQVQLQELQHDLQALQAAPVVKPAAPADATLPPGGKARAERQGGTNTTPPFKVLGVELRGGQRMLSILPAGSQSMTSVLLLGAGQHIGQWRLEAIERRHAVFKVGDKVREQTRRIPIPQ
jgi:hypothetical protein